MLYKKREKRNSVEEIVIALCLDYKRRKEELILRRLPRRVLMEYAYLNSKILTAAGEITGGAMAEAFIEDIGLARGYVKSEIVSVSESVYKKYKKAIKAAIAKKLNLI